MNKKPIHIIIADSQFLIREALKELLGWKCTLIDVAETREDLISFLKTHSELLVILDFKQFDFDNVNEIADLKKKFPLIRILILTDSLNQSELSELSTAGIKNFLLKSADEAEFFRAIECTLQGRKYYSDELLDLLIDNRKKSQSIEPYALTAAELDVVKLISEGKTAKEIASIKFISFHTVMTHRKNIFRKLGVTNASELIMYAIRKGWIDNIEYYI